MKKYRLFYWILVFALLSGCNQTTPTQKALPEIKGEYYNYLMDLAQRYDRDVDKTEINNIIQNDINTIIRRYKNPTAENIINWFSHEYSADDLENGLSNIHFSIAETIKLRRGACNTLPTALLIYLEYFGVPSWTVTGKYHGYLKYRSQNGEIITVETTQKGKRVKDSEYIGQDNLPITFDSVKIGGRDLLNPKESALDYARNRLTWFLLTHKKEKKRKKELLKQFKEDIDGLDTKNKLKPKGYSTLGAIFAEDKQDAESAEKYCKSALILEPMDFDANLVMAEVYLYKDNKAAAAKILNLLLLKYPNVGLVHRTVSDFHRKYNNLSLALRHIKKVIEISPRGIDKYELYLREANILFSMKRYKEAIISASKGIIIDPDRFELYGVRAPAYSSIKEYRKAYVDLEKILKMDPENKIARKLLEKVKAKL